jgi:hypothetical protein
LVPIRDLSKNPAFPAIRASGKIKANKKTAVFCLSSGFPRVLAVKADYFTFMKKQALKARSNASRNSLPGAESASGG